MQNKTTSCVYTNKIAKRQQIIAEIAYICKFMLLLFACVSEEEMI